MFRRLLLLCLSLTLCACTHTVSFDVVVPAETPTGSQLIVEGVHSVFGASGVALQPAADGHYAGKVQAPKGTFSYTVALATPHAPELGPGWEPITHQLSVTDQGASESVTVARWDLPPAAGMQHLTYAVTAPASTPATDTLYVLGSDPALGAWTMPGTAMTLRSDGKYGLRVDLPIGAHGSSMITRGTWRKIERGTTHQPSPDRAYTLGTDPLELDATVGEWLDLTYNSLTGNIEHINGVTSRYVAARNVIVYLPPGYSDAANASTRYPVLYLHDGQNLFDASSAFAGEWNADETAERLINDGTVAPLIIVGVYNVGPNRILDYTPVADPSYGGGGADPYGNFLIRELKPLIDARYRTLTDAANTGVGGSSLGGLVSLHFGLTHSEVFSHIVAMSPSVWWDNRDILGRVNALSGKLPLTIWEDMGTAEGSTPAEDLQNARDLRDAFVGKGWVLDSDLHYLEAAGAAHNESAWSHRFPSVLQALYPR